MEAGAIQPMWKERSEKTCRRHTDELNFAEIDGVAAGGWNAMVLGDSMFERFQTTGAHVWPIVETNCRVFNAGVGGDKIQNLLYRLIDLKFCDYVPKSIKKIIVMIGSNNIETDDPRVMADGAQEVLNHLLNHRKTSSCSFTLVAIPPRLPSEKNIKKTEKVKKVEASRQEYNSLLQSLAKKQGVEFADFSEKFGSKGCSDEVIDHDLYDDVVHFNTTGYEIFAPLLRDLIGRPLAMAAEDRAQDPTDAVAQQLASLFQSS